MAVKYWTGKVSTATSDSNNWSLTQGGAATTVPTSADDVFFDTTATRLSVNFDAAITFKSMTFSTAYAITCTGTSVTVVNDCIFASGSTVGTNGSTLTLSGTGTLTTNGVTLPWYVSQTGTTTRTLGSAVTISSSYYYGIAAAGTLLLNDFNLTCGFVQITNNASIKNINFATYSAIYLTGTSGIVHGGTAASFTTSAAYTNHPKPVYWNSTTKSSSLGAYVESSALSWYVSGAGSSPLSGNVKNATFTSWTGSQDFGTMAFFGDLVLDTTGTYTASANMYFVGSNMTYSQPTRTLRFNGSTITTSSNIYFNSGSTTTAVTWVLADAANFTTNPALNLQNGGIDLGGKTLTCGYFHITSSTNWFYYNNQTSALPGGTIVCGGFGSLPAFICNTSGSPPLNGVSTPGKVSFTAANQKLFTPNNSRNFDGIISQDGAGELVMGNTNCTYDGLAVGYTGGNCTITFQAGGNTTLKVGNTNWGVSGAASNKRVTLQTNATSVSGRIGPTQRHTMVKPDGGFGNYVDARDIYFYPTETANGSTPVVWRLGANSTAWNCVGAACIAGTQSMYVIADPTITSFTLPSDWDPTNNYIYAYGAGGGGSGGVRAGNYFGNKAGGGGGFVGYANYPAPANTTIPITIGSGGAGAGGQNAPAGAGSVGSDGGNTVFGNSTYGTITAYGGQGGQANAVNTGIGSTSRGAGGSGSGPAGAVIATGGAGGGVFNGPYTGNVYMYGSGGGGAGGATGNGNTGGGSVITTGTPATYYGFGSGGGGSGGKIGNSPSSSSEGGNNFYNIGGAFSNSTISANSYSGGGGLVRSTTNFPPYGGADARYLVGGGGGWGGIFTTSPAQSLSSTPSNYIIGGGGGSAGSSLGTVGAGQSGSHGAIAILYNRYVAQTGGSSAFFNFF